MAPAPKKKNENSQIIKDGINKGKNIIKSKKNPYAKVPEPYKKKRASYIRRPERNARGEPLLHYRHTNSRGEPLPGSIGKPYVEVFGEKWTNADIEERWKRLQTVRNWMYNQKLMEAEYGVIMEQNTYIRHQVKMSQKIEEEDSKRTGFFGKISSFFSNSSGLEERRQQMVESMHDMAVNSWADEEKELTMMFRELGVDPDGKPIAGKEQKIYIPEDPENFKKQKPVIKDKVSKDADERRLTRKLTLEDDEDLDFNIGHSELEDPFREDAAKKPEEGRDIGALVKKRSQEAERKQEEMILSPGGSLPVVDKYTAQLKRLKEKENQEDPDEYEIYYEEKDHPLKKLVVAANEMMAAWGALYEGDFGEEKYTAFLNREKLLLDECAATEALLRSENPDAGELIPNLDYVRLVANDVIRADHLALGREMSRDQARAIRENYVPGESVNPMTDTGKEAQGENAERMLKDLLTVPMHYEDFTRGIRTLYLYVRRLLNQGVSGMESIGALVGQIGGFTIHWEHVIEDGLLDDQEQFAKFFPGTPDAAGGYKMVQRTENADIRNQFKQEVIKKIISEHRFRFGAYIHKFVAEQLGDQEKAAFICRLTGKEAFAREDLYGIAVPKQEEKKPEPKDKKKPAKKGAKKEEQTDSYESGELLEDAFKQLDDLLMRPMSSDAFRQETALFYDRLRRLERFGLKGLLDLEEIAKVLSSLKVDWGATIDEASRDEAGFEKAFPGSKDLRDRWREISGSAMDPEEKSAAKENLIPQFLSRNAISFLTYARAALSEAGGSPWTAFAARYGQDGLGGVPTPIHPDANYEYERFNNTAKAIQAELRFVLTTTVTLSEFRSTVQGLQGTLSQLVQANNGQVDPRFRVTKEVVNQLFTFTMNGRDNLKQVLNRMERGERRRAFGDPDASKNQEALTKWNTEKDNISAEDLDGIRLDFGAVMQRYCTDLVQDQEGLSKEELLSYLKAVITDNREHPEGEAVPEISSGKLWELEAMLDNAIAAAHPANGAEPQPAYVTALLNTEKVVITTCRRILASDQASDRLKDEVKKLMIKATRQDFTDRGILLPEDDEMLRENAVNKADYVPGESRLAVTGEYDKNVRKAVLERLAALLPRRISDGDITPTMLSEQLKSVVAYYEFSTTQEDRERDGEWALLKFLAAYRMPEAKDFVEVASLSADEGRGGLFGAEGFFERMDALDAMVAQIGYSGAEADKQELAGSFTVEEVLTNYVVKYGQAASQPEGQGGDIIQAWFSLVNEAARNRNRQLQAEGGGEAAGLKQVSLKKYEAIRLWQRAKKPGVQFAFDAAGPEWAAFLAKAGEIVADCRRLLGGNENEAETNRIKGIIEVILRMDLDLRGIWNVDDGQIAQALDTYVPGQERAELSPYEKEVEEALNDVLPQDFEDEQAGEDFKRGYAARVKKRLEKLLFAPLNYPAFLFGIEKLADYVNTMAGQNVQGLEGISGLLGAMKQFRVNWVARIEAASGDENTFAAAFPGSAALRARWREISASNEPSPSKMASKRNLVPEFLQKNAFCFAASIREFLTAEGKARELEEFTQLFGDRLAAESTPDENYEYERRFEGTQPVLDGLRALFAEPKTIQAFKEGIIAIKAQIPQDADERQKGHTKTIRKLLTVVSELAMHEDTLRLLIRDLDAQTMRQVFFEQDEQAGLEKREALRNIKAAPQPEGGGISEQEGAFFNETAMYFGVLLKHYFEKTGEGGGNDPDLAGYVNELITARPVPQAGAAPDPNVQALSIFWRWEKEFTEAEKRAHPPEDVKARIPADVLKAYSEVLAHVEREAYKACFPMLADIRITNNRLREGVIGLLTRVIKTDFGDRGLVLTDQQAAMALTADYVPGESRVAVTAEEDAAKRDEAIGRLREILQLSIGSDQISADAVQGRLKEAIGYFNTTKTGAGRETDSMWNLINLLSNFTLLSITQLMDVAPANRMNHLSDRDVFNKLDALQTLDVLYPEGGYGQNEQVKDKKGILSRVRVHQLIQTYVYHHGNPITISAWQELIRGLPAEPEAGAGGQGLAAIQTRKYECIGLWQRAKQPVQEGAENPNKEAFYAKATETVQEARALLAGQVNEEEKAQINRVLEIILRMDFDLRGMQGIPAGQVTAVLNEYVPRETRLAVSEDEERQKNEEFDNRLARALAAPLSTESKQALKVLLEQMQKYYSLTRLEGRTQEREQFITRCLEVLSGDDLPADYAALVEALDNCNSAEDFAAYVAPPEECRFFYEQWSFLKKQAALLQQEAVQQGALLELDEPQQEAYQQEQLAMLREDKMVLAKNINLGMLIGPTFGDNDQAGEKVYFEGRMTAMFSLEDVQKRMTAAKRSGTGGGIGSLVPGGEFAVLPEDEPKIVQIKIAANLVMNRWKEIKRNKRRRLRQPQNARQPMVIPPQFTQDIRALVRLCDEYFVVEPVQNRNIGGQDVEVVFRQDEINAEIQKRKVSAIGRQILRLQEQAIMADYEVHGNTGVNREQARAKVPNYLAANGEIIYNEQEGVQANPQQPQGQGAPGAGQNGGQPEGQEQVAPDQILRKFFEGPKNPTELIVALREDRAINALFNSLGQNPNLAGITGVNAVLRDIHRLFSVDANRRRVYAEFGEQQMLQITYMGGQIFLANLIGFYIRRHGDAQSKAYWQEHFRGMEVAVGALRAKKEAFHETEKRARILHRQIRKILLGGNCKLKDFITGYSRVSNVRQGLEGQLGEGEVLPDELQGFLDLVNTANELIPPGEGGNLAVANNIMAFLRGQSFGVLHNLFGTYYNKSHVLRDLFSAQGTGNYAGRDEVLFLNQKQLPFGKILAVYLKQKGSADVQVLLDDIIQNNRERIGAYVDPVEDPNDYVELPENDGNNINLNDREQVEPPENEHEDENIHEEEHEDQPQYIIPGGGFDLPQQQRVYNLYHVKNHANTLLGIYTGNRIDDPEDRKDFYDNLKYLGVAVDKAVAHENTSEENKELARRILKEAIVADFKIHGYDITLRQAERFIQYFRHPYNFKSAGKAIRAIHGFAAY